MRSIRPQLMALALLAASFAYGSDYSSSPSYGVNLSPAQRQATIQSAAATDAITFSEYPVGTSISNQYADRGIVFDGDSPFITKDGANPTSPALSGSPRFMGAIVGRFVDPVTHQPATVSRFELDAGYFDNLSSTRLQWFDSTGALISERRDEEIGIQHFVVEYEGIASWRIEIVSQEDAGYAIDNISFNHETVFDHSFDLDKITHTRDSKASNTFTIYFKNLVAKNGKTLGQVCQDYSFVVADRRPGIVGNSCSVNTAEAAFRVDFEIAQSPYNIENANVSVCRDAECKTLADIRDFSVYGTSFNATVDGYSFPNGGWSKLLLLEQKEVSWASTFCWMLDRCTDSQVSYLGSLANLSEAFQQFVSESRREDVLKMLGYYKFGESEWTHGGTCHGLAVSAIANFNNKSNADAWASVLEPTATAQQIASLFQAHWTNRDADSAKPYAKTVFAYKEGSISDSFHSVGKIGFYFLSQGSFSGGDAWVGQSGRVSFNSVDNMVALHRSRLSQGVASSFSFDLMKNGKRTGGHTIIATELIQYNGHNVMVLHDNNFIGDLRMLEIDGSSKVSAFVVDASLASVAYTKYGDFTTADPYDVDSYSGFRTYSEGGLRLYGAGVMLAASAMQTVQAENQPVPYSYPNHLSVNIFGAKLQRVTDISTQQEVVLQPIVGELKTDQAYLLENAGASAFLLPADGLYKVEIQKFKQFPTLDVYVKIPTADGAVEVLNYEDLAIDPRDDTEAYFFVGRDNADKTIRREGGSDVVPAYDRRHDTGAVPATALKAVMLPNGVRLSWNLGDNLKEVVLVRKDDSAPASVTDGEEVYRGLGETYTDLSALGDSKYYYGLYSIARNDDISDAEIISLDTHKASLSGHVSDADGAPIMGARVLLKNGVGIDDEPLDSDFSDDNGFFSFANLPHGIYRLEALRDSYDFSGSGVVVDLETENREVSLTGIAKPVLGIAVNDTVTVGSDETISWNGNNIADDALIDIKVSKGAAWEALATRLRFSDSRFTWHVGGPGDEKQVVRIELSGDTAVAAEKEVAVLGGVIVTPSVGSGPGAIQPDAPQSVERNGTLTFTVTPDAGHVAMMGGTCGGTLMGNTYTSNPITVDCTVSVDFIEGDQLHNGVTVRNQSVDVGQWKYYVLSVPAGAASLTFATIDANADVDIYVGNTKPTLSSFVCRPYTWDGNETCVIPNPDAGTWWIGVYGYESASYSLVGSIAMVGASYTVTPVVTAGGTVSPNLPQKVAANSTAEFAILAHPGYVKVGVTGNCPPGFWTGDYWITGEITSACTVVFEFFCEACLPGQGGWRAAIESK